MIKKKETKSEHVKRISISLPPSLLDRFDKYSINSGFSDRSKAIQTALYEFIDRNEWETNDDQEGAGTIVILYNNKLFLNDKDSIQSQHEHKDIIITNTHLHLNDDNCLETIIVKGKVKRIKNFVKEISENRGIRSIKMHYVGTTGFWF